MESITEIFAMVQELFSFVEKLETSGILDALKEALASVLAFTEMLPL